MTAKTDVFRWGEFHSPSVCFAPVYTWAWNSHVTEEEIDRQLDEMQSLAIKRFYILPIPKSFRPRKQPSLLEPDYLTPRYMELYRHAIASAKKRGMDVWLYDEGGWPSGGACGAVIERRPDLIGKILVKKEIVVKKNTPYAAHKDAVIAFSGTEKVSNGDTFPRRKRITEYRTTEKRSRTSADIPDLTNEESTEEFLRSTHEKYAETIGDFFGDTVTAVFCDEPTSPGILTYREDLAAEFSARYGIDIRSYIPYLFQNKVPRDVAEVKIKWYSFLSEKFCNGFLRKERAWSERHGMEFVGHVDKDDEINGWASGGNFDPMRALSCFDLPGVDVIYRQIFPEKSRYTSKMSFFPRMASSVAAQSGKRRTLTESFAVYGNGLTFEEMRYILNYQAIRGVNLFNLMLFSYGRTGFLRTGELPHFAMSHACYSDMAVFNEYTERLSYLFTLGKRVANVALYYPQRDLYAGKGDDFVRVGDLLEKRHILFDVFCEQTLQNADEKALDVGRISVGNADYDTLVVPASEYLTPKAREIMERFIQGGGKVYTTDKTINGAIVDENYSIPSALPFIGNADGFSVAESATENGKLLFIMNEGKEKDCRIKTDKPPYLIDIALGRITKPQHKNDVCRFHLFAGEIAALYFTDEILPAEDVPEPTPYASLSEWTGKKAERFVIGKEDLCTVLCAQREKKIALGDWRKKMGGRYSGTVEYRTCFHLPKGTKEIIVDLGKVNYSCEAILNGVSLGKRVFAPYRFTATDILEDNNELLVRVKNTVANEFLRTTSFRKYKKYQLTQYIKREKSFMRSSLPSGLFGPVRVFLVK